MPEFTLCTTSEVARALGVNDATVRRWVTAQAITPAATTAGGHYRFVMDDVLAQLAARGQTAS